MAWWQLSYGGSPSTRKYGSGGEGARRFRALFTGMCRHHSPSRRLSAAPGHVLVGHTRSARDTSASGEHGRPGGASDPDCGNSFVLQSHTGKLDHSGLQTKAPSAKDKSRLFDLQYSKGNRRFALSNPLDSWDFISASSLAECHKCLTTYSGRWHDDRGRSTCHACFVDMHRLLCMALPASFRMLCWQGLASMTWRDLL